MKEIPFNLPDWSACQSTQMGAKMGRNKTYTAKSLWAYIAVLIVLMALYLLACTSRHLLYNGRPDSWGQRYDPAGIFVLVVMGVIGPILIFLGWYMCIERFVRLKLQSAPRPMPLTVRLHICILSAYLVCSSIHFMKSAMDAADCCFGSYKALLGEEYVQWLAAFSAEALCWLLAILWCTCRMCSMDVCRSGKAGWAKLALLVCLAIGLYACCRFTNDARWVALREMDRMRYYELNGVEDIMSYGLADKYFGKELRSDRPPQLQYYPARRQKSHRRFFGGNHRIRYYVIRPYGQTKGDLRKTLYPPQSPHKRHFITERKNGSG